MPKTESTCGIDVGLKDFAILSDGTTYKNPTFFRILEEKLAKAQRILSRRTKGSSNWHKQRVKVAQIHEHVANARADYLHKLSAEIIKKHDVIGKEYVRFSGMLKNTCKSSWSQFQTLLEYKAKWYGKQLVVLSKTFASRQLCSNCNYKNKDAKNLTILEWDCPYCGTHYDRDRNTVFNHRNESIPLLTLGTMGIAY